MVGCHASGSVAAGRLLLRPKSPALCLLRSIGVSAYQVSVYHRTGVAQHCLVAAQVEDREVPLDPSYGIQYRGLNGEPLGFSDLRAGALHTYVPLPYSTAVDYPAADYYQFSFRDTRTAGWTRTALLKTIYSLLRSLSNGRIDTLPQPWWMEWPQLILSILVVAGGV